MQADIVSLLVVCKGCGESKPQIKFYKDRTKESGYRSICKDCSSKHYKKWRNKNPQKIDRKRNLWRNFKITPEQFDVLLQAQNYQCAICECSPEDFKKGFAVDHCHKTLRIRALLCGNCNTSLGLMKEDISRLQKAIDYLKKHNGST